ncbi:SRPBCC family protein [Chloroflexota bacterium]
MIQTEFILIRYEEKEKARMAKVDKEIWIETPIEKIFGYISDPRNLPEFWPSLMEIKDVQSLPDGGYSARWVYKMMGMRFDGTGKYTQIVPHQFFVIETEGGIRSKIAWTVRSWGNKTRVTLSIEYKIPIPLLGKLAEAIIVKMNDHEGDLIMANLQARFMIANH